MERDLAMKKIVLALFCSVAMATPLFAQDDVTATLKQMQADLNGILAMQTATKARIDNQDAQIASLNARLDALTKTVTQQPSVTKTWKPAAVDVWGRVVTPGQWVSVGTDAPAEPITPPVATASWGSSTMMSTGACAGGSCGTGAGMRGIGIFRLRR